MSTSPEHRAYARGYAAGRVRKIKDADRDAERRKRDAFWQRAFIAVLPSVVLAKDWKRGDTPILGVPDRIRLATEIANEALSAATPHL